MTWYKIQHPLQVTTDEGHSVTIPSGLWRVEASPQIVMIGMTNKQTRIEPEQWAAILRERLAQPLPPWEDG